MIEHEWKAANKRMRKAVALFRALTETQTADHASTARHVSFVNFLAREVVRITQDLDKVIDQEERSVSYGREAAERVAAKAVQS